MSKQNTFGPWLSYFYASLRRQPNARKYQYVNNLPQIKSFKLQNVSHRLKHPKTTNIPIPVYLEQNILDTDLSKLQNLLVADSKNVDGVPLGFHINNISGEVPDRNIITSILRSPVLPDYLDDDYFNKALQEIPFNYKHTIKLELERPSRNLRNLDRILWPDLVFSNFCRGIAVSPELYKQLLMEDNHFKSPTNNSLLPIFKSNSIPDGYSMMGLFPKFDTEQKKLFTKGPDAAVALIGGRPCSGSQYMKVRERVTSTISKDVSDKQQDNTFSNAVQFYPYQSTTHPSRDTLRKFLVIARSDSLLWTNSLVTDKTCPGDILRATLLAKNTNKGSLRREFMKNFTLFNVMSQAKRLNTHKSMREYPDEQLPIKWQPWDYYILEQYTKLTNNFKTPDTLEALQLARYTFSDFLRRLFEYQCLITAEMKVQGEAFFTNKYAPETPSRCYAVSRLLIAILRFNPVIETLYPGLALYAENQLVTPQQYTENSLPSENEPKSVELQERIMNIIREMISFESKIFNDKFTAYKKMVSQLDSPVKDWKIIILNKKPFTPEQVQILKYHSRIFTQFAYSFEEIDKISYSICVETKMIDEDTIIYLYKMNREKKSSLHNMVAHILQGSDDIDTKKTNEIATD